MCRVRHRDVPLVAVPATPKLDNTVMVDGAIVESAGGTQSTAEYMIMETGRIDERKKITILISLQNGMQPMFVQHAIAAFQFIESIRIVCMHVCCVLSKTVGRPTGRSGAKWMLSSSERRRCAQDAPQSSKG